MKESITLDNPLIQDLRLNAIVDATPECIKIVAEDGSLVYMNSAGLGMVEATSLDDVKGSCIFNVIAPEHRETWRENHRRVCFGESLDWQFEIIGLKGTRRFMETHAVPLTTPGGGFLQLALTRDISERRHAERELNRNQIILQGQNQALELAIHGGLLAEILDILTLTFERFAEEKVLTSILLMDKEGKYLLHGSAPHLPDEYNRAIHHLEIGPDVGSCGTAAYLKKEVIVHDIQTDPLWVNFKHLAAAHGLAACWSTPIISSGTVLGTFAVYYTEPRKPGAEERKALELLSRTASVIIERFRETEQRREAEAALHSSDQHLRALMRATNDVVYKMNADWTVMQALDGRDLLADTGEPIRDWLQKYIHPADQSFVSEKIRESIETKSTFQLEHRVIQADGSIGWTFSRAIPIFDEKENVIEWFGAASDVTQRKKAEEALRESEESFRAMADNIPNLAWMANADGWIFWYNQKWYDYTGTTPEQMEGWGWRSVHDPAYLPKVLDRWQDSIRDGVPFEMVFPLKSAQGEFRPFLTRVLPVKDSEGKIVRWFGTNTDVTSQKQEEEKLEKLVRERTAQLERSNQDLMQFAHVTSHDLREPLRKILTFSDRLEAELKPVLTGPARQYLDKITISSQRMSNMIAGVLTYSQLNNEEQEPRPVDLNEVIEHIKLDLEVLIQQTGARIDHGPLPSIEGAPVLIFQLFYNLVNNSIKFRKPDIAPHIYVEQIESKPGWAHIRVSDNGIGFEQKYAELVFDTFSRLHPKDRYEGTGLGLALCQKIVQRHGGSIWAESKKGEGAYFHVKLPETQPSKRL